MHRLVPLCFVMLALLAPTAASAQGAPDDVAEPAGEEGLPTFGEEQPSPSAEPSDGEAGASGDEKADTADEGGAEGGGEADAAGVLPMPLTAALQFGTGCLVMGPAQCVGSVFSGVPVVGFILNPLVTWAIVSGVVGTLGDSFGPNQGTWLWPGVAGFCTGTACMTLPSLVYGGAIAAMAVVFYAGLVASVFATMASDGDPAALMTALGSLYAALIGSILAGLVIYIPVITVGQAVASAAVTGTYWYTSEPKQPGDGGFSLPGIFSPRHARPDSADDEYEEEGEAKGITAMAF